MDTRKTIDRVIEEKRKGIRARNPEGERLHEDLGLDSLDVMEIIMECERELNVRIPDSMCVGLKVKEDLYRLFDEVENS